MNKIKILKKSLIFANLLGLLVFLIPEYYALFGRIGGIILCFILIIRPINDLLPKRNITFIVNSRRELGILCATFILAHAIGYFLFFGINILDVLNTKALSVDGYLFWGLLGLFFMALPLLTSNNLAIKLLKKNWKRIQRLTYLFFIAGAVHVAIVKPSYQIGIISFIIILVVLLVLAYYKNHDNQK